MGLFSGIKEARVNEGGVYLAEGLYRLQIQRVKADLTRKRIPFLVSEFRVLESTNPQRPVGCDCSWMVTLDKDAALGNIKQFVSVVGSKPLDQVEESDVDELVSPANPAKGLIVRASAVNIKTKAGTDFTRVKFYPDEDSAGAAEDAKRGSSTTASDTP